MIVKGIILKNQNGYFSILGEGEKLALCRSRGKLKQKTNILVGDKVEYETDKGSEAVISKVYPRKNQLHRPPVANIDQLVLVSAIRTPDLNIYLLDKMVLLAEDADIEPIIVINKCDLAHEEAERVKSYYEKAGYACFLTSAATGEGVEVLKAHLTGPIVSFSGPSGAGKSSLLNQILEESRFESGAVSRQTGRGRTTTRHAELVKAKSGVLLMDTPGYTLLDVLHISKENLPYLFRDFRPYLGECRFNNCIHHKEPDCAVREAVESGDIQKRRYESYIEVLEEIKSSGDRRPL